MVTDPISDMLTRIRNAQRAGHEMVSVPASKLKIAIAAILKEEGFVKNYRCIRDGRQGLIKVLLKYDESEVGTIQHIERISRSSKRSYMRADKLPFVRNGFGVGIYSTSKGIMTDREARKANIGGEYLCRVY